MALRVTYVRALADVVDPVADWLQSAPAGRGLFATEHLLLPTNGAKAWLLPELAKRIGVRTDHSNGVRTDHSDGVVANVQVGYLGSLNRFIVPHRYREVDPWSIETMTVAILGIITNDDLFAPLIRRCGGALAAAARLADRFDRYHARRPMMIRAWEKGSPVMAPSTADSFNDGEWRAADLGDQRWQFDLWQRLRQVVGVPPWPVQVEDVVAKLRRGENVDGVPNRLMVAGMQSLSLGAIELLDAFGCSGEVEVLLVHPSPVLARRWAASFADTEVPRGALQLRPVDEELPDDVHPFVHLWLRGSRELQQMLASQGITTEPHRSFVAPDDRTVLGRIQGAVAGDGLAPRIECEDNDPSLQVHRCYNLTRQVEVLHDALLHAFGDLDDLAPHEVLIVSPRLVEAAPILEAVFDRAVTIERDGANSEIRIPLVVAERQLRYISEGAELLGNLLELVRGRFDVSAFLAVATSPLVVNHLGIGSDSISIWNRQIERTRIRWGLSVDQRTAAGLAPEADGAHTWRTALERSLLGAALPDADPKAELGGIVPLDDIGVDDIDSLARLVQVFDAIEELEITARSGELRDISEWCETIGKTVAALCGSSDQIMGAIELLDGLASSTVLSQPGGSTQRLGAAVSFGDVANHVLGKISGVPGHQPLRTGAVTATSMMPLRGVPYRVVCLLGVDDGVFGGSETESDDLIGRQVFIGDDDPRIDSRRQLLDAVLSARDRVIITCDGRSIHNNATIPLTTALAEFVDFGRRHGVANRRHDGADTEGTNIEYLHPRHGASRRNFIVDGVMPGRVWSHSIGLRDVAGHVGATTFTARKRGGAPVVPLNVGTGKIVELDSLTAFATSPLEMFVKDSLGISTWVDSHAPNEAVIPLTVDGRAKRKFVEGYLAGRSGWVQGWDPVSYVRLARLSGDVPVGAYGDAEIMTLQALAESIMIACSTYSVQPVPPEPTSINVSLANDVVVRGSIPHLQSTERMIGVVRSSKYYDIDHVALAVRLLVATAGGLNVRHGISIHQHNDNKKSDQAQARLVYLSDGIDADDARRRLRDLVTLQAIAAVTPLPFFGDTVDAMFADPEKPDFVKGAERFARFVGSEGFRDSLEYRIYGSEPVFQDLFDAGGLFVDFWSRFRGAFRIIRGKASSVPGKLPHGNSHWAVV